MFVLLMDSDITKAIVSEKFVSEFGCVPIDDYGDKQGHFGGMSGLGDFFSMSCFAIWIVSPSRPLAAAGVS